jgi:tetratricopeptide (TPR) repeat protein
VGAEVTDDTDRAEVTRICRLVDGMPLGIELAAAWTSVLSCQEIGDEIERSIGFLESSARDVEERHRSLRATIHGSWVLLTDEQRKVLGELSVLRGTFTRDAAEAVAGATPRILLELVNRSLIRRSPLGRFELHELLRQYAGEQLSTSPSDLEARERHARFYVGLLQARATDLLDERMIASRDELQLDADNILEAVSWAVQRWNEDETLRVIAVLYDLYWMQSWFEGIEGLRHLASLVDPDTAPADAGPIRLSLITHRNAAETALSYEERLEAEALECLPRLRELGMTRELGKCLTALGTIACYVDVYEDSVAYLREAVEVAEAAGDRIELCAALSWLGFSLLLLDDLVGARAAFEAGNDVAVDMGNVVLRAYLLSKLGLLADAEGVYEDAIRIHLQASEMFGTAGDAGGNGYALSRASGSAYMLGDMQEAMRLGIAGYEGFAEVNHRWGMIGALSRIAFASIALGDLTGARAQLRDALERAHDTQARSLEMLALSGVGVLLEREGKPREAAELLTFALDPLVLPRLYSLASRPVLEELERTLPPSELAELRDSAAGLKLDDLIDEALRTHLA